MTAYTTPIVKDRFSASLSPPYNLSILYSDNSVCQLSDFFVMCDH